MNHEKHLKRLLNKIKVETPSHQKSSKRTWVSMPRELKSKSKFSPVNTLSLFDKEVDFYYDSFEKLRTDDRTEYLRENELKDKLDILIWEVWLDDSERNNEKFFENKIEEFLEDIFKPLEEYEIIFKINNLKIEKEVTLWDCLIKNFSKEELIIEGFDKNGLYEISDFENKTLIFVKEVGNNNSLIIERARKKANFAIKILQSYLSEMRLILNDQLLFSLSTDYVVRKTSDSRLKGGWKRNFSPILFDNENAFAKFTDKANDHYKKIYSFNSEVKNAIERVFYWIGKSVSEPDFDIKLTLLFTALETLLTTKRDGLKGERISYRVALLSSVFDKAYIHPAEILTMYKMRNDIIHGSKVEIVSKNECLELMCIVRETLDFYIKFAEKFSAKNPSDVINKLIKSQHSEKLQKWLTQFSDENSKEIAKILLEDIKNILD